MSTSALSAGIQSGHGGFRQGVTPQVPDTTSTARRLQSFLAGGTHEAIDLATKVQVYGAAWTMRNELRTERDYVQDAPTRGRQILRAGQSGSQLVGVMLTIILAAAIGFVSVKINSEVENSITDKDLSATADENQTVYENASESISGGFTDSMGLIDIVFLVLMFGVILGALLAFRGTR